MVTIFVLADGGVWWRWGDCTNDTSIIEQTLEVALKSGKYIKAKAIDGNGQMVDMAFA